MSDNPEQNDQLVLIAGESGTGKSASLRNIKNQERWIYFNCEAGKRLPFRNKFIPVRVEHPQDVLDILDESIENPSNVDGAVLDSVTFLMEMYETKEVLTSENTQGAWQGYQQYFKWLMQDRVIRFKKPMLITAHTKDVLDEKEHIMKTSVPIKGALKNNGVEAYFSTVVAAKKVTLKDLEPYQSDLLHITEEDKELGYKHVFQTRITSKTVGERIRSPMGLFSKNQTFMDNDAQLLLDHLHKYYG